MTRWRWFSPILLLLALWTPASGVTAGMKPSHPKPSQDLARHLSAIASMGKPSPMLTVPAGPFLLGTKHADEIPYGISTQFDDTEVPQHRVWLDTFDMDRNEVSLGEYLAFLQQRKTPSSDELQKLIWHVITIHSVTDDTLSRWPALYVTWKEAQDLCQSAGKRLPTEAEWEKAARGVDGGLFPWGSAVPDTTLATFGQHHVHEIPILAPVDSLEDGRSPYGLHHMAGNVAEWVQDWFGSDYYAYMPEKNPPGPTSGRYKSVRGGSWKSMVVMLRTATRSGSEPEKRSPTIGFRCAKSVSVTAPDPR